MWSSSCYALKQREDMTPIGTALVSRALQVDSSADSHASLVASTEDVGRDRLLHWLPAAAIAAEEQRRTALPRRDRWTLRVTARPSSDLRAKTLVLAADQFIITPPAARRHAATRSACGR